MLSLRRSRGISEASLQRVLLVTKRKTRTFTEENPSGRRGATQTPLCPPSPPPPCLSPGGHPRASHQKTSDTSGTSYKTSVLYVSPMPVASHKSAHRSSDVRDSLTVPGAMGTVGRGTVGSTPGSVSPVTSSPVWLSFKD